jgi:hypothetical protein
MIPKSSELNELILVVHTLIRERSGEPLSQARRFELERILLLHLRDCEALHQQKIVELRKITEGE